MCIKFNHSFQIKLLADDLALEQKDNINNVTDILESHSSAANTPNKCSTPELNNKIWSNFTSVTNLIERYK